MTQNIIPISDKLIRSVMIVTAMDRLLHWLCICIRRMCLFHISSHIVGNFIPWHGTTNTQKCCSLHIYIRIIVTHFLIMRIWDDINHNTQSMFFIMRFQHWTSHRGLTRAQILAASSCLKHNLVMNTALLAYT